jgi:hypothetical protein
VLEQERKRRAQDDGGAHDVSARIAAPSGLPPPPFAPPTTYLGGGLEEQADAGGTGILGEGAGREEAKGQERTAGEHGRRCGRSPNTEAQDSVWNVVCVDLVWSVLVYVYGV